MEWQPIETAPFNKFVLLGFFYPNLTADDIKNYTNNKDADCFIQLGKMSDGYESIHARVYCGAPSNHYSVLNLDVVPTHWMPLPPPPKE